MLTFATVDNVLKITLQRGFSIVVNIATAVTYLVLHLQFKATSLVVFYKMSQKKLTYSTVKPGPSGSNELNSSTNRA